MSKTTLEVKNKTILKAIARNDIEDVKRHIKNHADLNKQNKSGWTTLHYAAVRGNTAIAKILLENNATINIKTKSKKTALHFAANRNFIDFAKLLIEKGADISARDKEGWSPLHHAAVKSHTKMVELLLDNGAEVNLLSVRGGTALHEAAASANADTINMLLAHGAIPAIKATNGKTPLDYAIELGNKEAEKVLKDAIKQISPNQKKIRILLTFGGHGFQKEKFFKMFDNLPEVKYTKHNLLKDPNILKPGLEKEYDVIVMYDMIKKPFTPGQKKNFIALLNKGIGIVALHHNLGGHSIWDEYRKIIGGKYIRKNEEFDGQKYKPSGFAHGQDIDAVIIDKNHPITKGLKDFTIHDETYGKYYVSSSAHLLMKTSHKKCNPEIAWTHKYGKSPVFYLMLGHDSKAWAHPSFKKILLQGIKWANSGD